MKKLSTLILLSCPAFAGQSIQLSSGVVGTSVPAQPSGRPWRIEFSIHNWPASWGGNIHALDGSAVGANIQFIDFGGGDLRLQVYSATTVGGAVCLIGGLGPGGAPGGGSIATNSFLTVRFQEDPAAKTDYCQAWDINGNQVFNQIIPYTSNTGTNFSGGSVTGFGAGKTLSTAYFRIYTSTVSTSSRPPVTADTLSNCLVFWKFDNSLNDSCPAGPYNAALSGGSAAYAATPGQGLVAPVMKTSTATAWSNIVSVRAGFPAQLDGTSSYSQADGSADVTCFWQSVSGPSTLIWDGRGSCTPTIRGLIFGDYKIMMVATDANRAQAGVTQDIGAVATDSNGVVINADPNVDFLFGPMIAFGKNPWGYQDYWAQHASQLRLSDYLSSGWIQGPLNQPQWEYRGQGTVSYYFNCVGAEYFCNSSQYGGTLSSAASLGASSLAVSTITGLDLSSFPTHLILYDGAASAEVRICSNSGTTLNVCYDGWGNNASHTFNAGTPVLQSKLSGMGTLFLSGSAAAICPVGAPGPPGPSAYSAGSIAVMANSASVTGSGTAWTTQMAGDFVRVPATHGGAAFIFVAQIAAVNSATSLTLNRTYPADADTGSGLAYDLMTANRTVALRYPHATDPTGLGELLFGISGGCESETAAYANPGFQGNSFASGHDIPALDGQHLTGTQYSITDTTGWVNQGSTGGISFYGESLAHRALYYRSGLASALTAANYISDYWMKSPWGNADGSGFPRLFLGGEGIGSFAAAILAGRVSWSDLRGYGAMGLQMVNGIATAGCNAYDDTRDSGYAYAWLILAGIFDPDTSSTAAPGGIPWRTYWQHQLAQMQTNDTNCENQVPAANHSFANGFLWNGSSPAWIVTNGSASVSGTGIPSNLCFGTASGTASVSNGANGFTLVTGSIPAGTNVVFLTGTAGAGASVFVQSFSYGGGLLGGEWLGDSGTVSWISGNIDGFPGDGTTSSMLTIATGNNDLTALQKNWACMWNSSTSVTLNRPWDGPSSDATHIYHPYGPGGFGQQPFMLGIKSYGESLLAKQTLPQLASLAAAYQTFTSNSTGWIWNFGMDHQLLGTNYGRVFQQCEPTNTAPAGVSLSVRTPFCSYGNDPTAVYLSREQNAETGAAHTIYYQNNPTGTNRTLGDEFYGALWGFCPWTTGGVYCDANSTAAQAPGSNLSDASIYAGKWYGFFSGVGMTHRWPAVRLGGVQPGRPRTVYLSIRVADVPGTASVKVIVTAPSSAQTSYTCAAQPCAVSVDDRQGEHFYQIQYLSAGGAVLSQSLPDLIGAQ